MREEGEVTVTPGLEVPRRLLRRRALAECGVCDWSSRSRWALVYAARHVAQTGHPVVGTYTAQYVYGDLSGWRVERVTQPQLGRCPGCVPEVVVERGWP